MRSRLAVSAVAVAVVVSGLVMGPAQAAPAPTGPATAAPGPLWVRTVTGPDFADSDYARAVAVDPSTGQVIVAGSSRQPHAGQPEADYDYLTVRFRGANGAVQGSDVLSSPGLSRPRGDDTVTDLVFDAQRRHTIVTGTSTGSDGDDEIATAAYDASGQLLWTARYDSGGPTGRADRAVGMALDPATGTVYVVGTSTTPGNEEADNARLVAYGPDGALLGTRAFGTADGRDAGVDVAVLPDGSAVATANDYADGAGITTVAVRSDGTLLWTRTYDDDAVSAHELAVDPVSGNVYVAVTLLQARVLSYTADGTFRWISALAPNRPPRGEPQLAVSPRGEVVLSSGHLDFDDAYVVSQRFSAAGERLTTRRTFTVSGPTDVVDLQVDPDTGYVYSLAYLSTDYFDAEILLLVYDAELRLRARFSYDSGATYDAPDALAIDSARNRVIVTGYTDRFGEADLLTLAYRTWAPDGGSSR